MHFCLEYSLCNYQSCSASFYLFFLLSQDSHKKYIESNLLIACNISSQGVDMECQWVIWCLTSTNAMFVTNAFLRHVQDKAGLVSDMSYTLFANTDVVMVCCSPLALSWTVTPLPQQAQPCWEGCFLSAQGLPSCPALYSPAGLTTAELLLT